MQPGVDVRYLSITRSSIVHAAAPLSPAAIYLSYRSHRPPRWYTFICRFLSPHVHFSWSLFPSESFRSFVLSPKCHITSGLRFRGRFNRQRQSSSFFSGHMGNNWEVSPRGREQTSSVFCVLKVEAVSVWWLQRNLLLTWRPKLEKTNQSLLQTDLWNKILHKKRTRIVRSLPSVYPLANNVSSISCELFLFLSIFLYSHTFLLFPPHL